MTVHYQDDTVTLLLGDAATVAATLEPQSIQTVVTSPPYFGLRDYGVDGQLGAENTPAEFIANLVAVFEAIRPALRDDGTLWVNLGDSYANPSAGWGRGGRSTLIGPPQDRHAPPRRKGVDRRRGNLLMIPARFALSMQDADWILRKQIVWNKPNAHPENVHDRPASKYELVYLFAKRLPYYYDAKAVRPPLAPSSVARLAQNVAEQAGSSRGSGGAKTNGPMRAVGDPDAGAILGDVWTMATGSFSEAHFATMPLELAERCILLGSRVGDLILDPFSGSATTGMVATKHGRRYIGIDLNAEYHQLALKTRLAQGVIT